MKLLISRRVLKFIQPPLQLKEDSQEASSEEYVFGRLLWIKCCSSPLCVSRCALLSLISRHFALDKDELMVQEASISIPCTAYELLIHEHFVAGIHYLVYKRSK